MSVESAVDVDAARAFVAANGRLIDRRRLERLLTGGDPGGLLAALDGYRNGDGGFGWGLEPDLRSPESQPAAAMHALELLAETGPAGTSRMIELCNWLAASSNPDGGLPVARPVSDRSGCARHWLNVDTESSSLQMTAQVAANAHHAARHHPQVGEHPWLIDATRWCLDVVARLDAAPRAYELLFAIRFLDAVADVEPVALDLLDQLRPFIPADGVVPVAGGAIGQALRPLDFAPRPGSPAQQLFGPAVLHEERSRLAAGQHDDGGWNVDYETVTPAAALEWRAYATIDALKILSIVN